MHICNYYNEGYSYRENILPIYQQRFGHEVIMVTSDRRSFRTEDSTSRVVSTGYSCDRGTSVLRLPAINEFKGRFVFFKDLKKTLEEQKPDYVFHHGLPAPSVITCALYKKRNPLSFLAVDNHADYHNSGKSTLYRFFYYRTFWRNILKFYSKYVDIFYSVTPNSMIFGENELGVPKAKHKLLYLGADIFQYKYSLEWREKIRNQLNIAHDDFIITTAGKITNGKRVDIIIQAMNELKIDNIKLLIIGPIDTKYAEYLDHCVYDITKIHKLGWVDSSVIYKYYSAADIAIFPGSQSVLWQQAISCELPIIIRHTPEVEYMISMNNGLFLFSDSYIELATIIDKLYKDVTLRNQFSKNAKKLRDDVLSYEVSAKQTINDYFEKIQNH